MPPSTLRQVLTIFETAGGPLSLSQIARQLGVPQARVEGMIQHWVRRGRLRPSQAAAGCGTCGRQGDCPFVITLPASYELAAADPLARHVLEVGGDCPARGLSRSQARG